VAKKKVKAIKIDIGKCTGCRVCEVICAAFHASPKYSAVNPSRSRIRVLRRELDNVYIPVIASTYAKAECVGRNIYISGSDEYGECAFCGASCPSRDLFKEPDSGLPLKCDMCEGEEEPLCVQRCFCAALTYEEKEEEVEEEKEEVKLEDLETAFKSLIKKYGKKKLRNTFAQLSKGQTIKAQNED